MNNYDDKMAYNFEASYGPSTLQLVGPDDPILRKVCRPDFSISLDDITQDVLLLRESGGLGLAAPQVGIDARLFITTWNDIFIDPVIVRQHRQYETQEGCLSLPGVTCRLHLSQDHLPRGRAAVRRPEGRRDPARMDHLDGILITDK